jgi:hypothetical protein
MIQIRLLTSAGDKFPDYILNKCMILARNKFRDYILISIAYLTFTPKATK